MSYCLNTAHTRVNISIIGYQKEKTWETENTLAEWTLTSKYVKKWQENGQIWPFPLENPVVYYYTRSL